LTSWKDTGEECTFPAHIVEKPEWTPALPKHWILNIKEYDGNDTGHDRKPSDDKQLQRQQDE